MKDNNNYIENSQWEKQIIYMNKFIPMDNNHLENFQWDKQIMDYTFIGTSVFPWMIIT